MRSAVQRSWDMANESTVDQNTKGAALSAWLSHYSHMPGWATPDATNDGGDRCLLLSQCREQRTFIFIWNRQQQAPRRLSVHTQIAVRCTEIGGPFHMRQRLEIALGSSR